MSKSNCERTAMHAVCNLAAVLKVCIAKRLKSVTATGEDGQACARPGRGREGLHALGGCGGCGASRCSFFVAGPSLPPSLPPSIAAHVTRMLMRQQTTCISIPPAIYLVPARSQGGEDGYRVDVCVPSRTESHLNQSMHRFFFDPSVVRVVPSNCAWGIRGDVRRARKKDDTIRRRQLSTTMV